MKKERLYFIVRAFGLEKIWREIKKDKIRMLKRIKNKSKSLTDYEYVCRIIRKELTKLGGK